MRTEEFDAMGQKLHVTEKEIRHPKSGKLENYLSFSNGQDVAGVFIAKDKSEALRTKIAKFLTTKEKKGGK